MNDSNGPDTRDRRRGDRDAGSSRPRRPLSSFAAPVAAFAVGLAVGGALVGGGGKEADAASTLTENAAFDTLEQTWELIHTEWAVPDQVDDAALLYGAAKGMVDALGDDGHSRFLDPADALRFQESTQGKFTGVGIEIDLRTGLPVVVAPIDGSPAAAAGVRSGDTILAVDGEETGRLSIEEIGELIRGDEGSNVTLTLLRRGDTVPFEMDLTRRAITLDPVGWRMLPNRVAQIRIAEFSAGATRQLKAALSEVRRLGGTAVVLDLRDNPGGLVSEAIGVASQFMDEGKTVFQQRDRDGEAQPMTTVGRDGIWLDRPLAVLVNGGSASAAEIVGGALRDNDRAPLLGTTTFGTGTVLLPYAQEDGSIVLLGTALWLTADGDQIWKEGVEPELEVVQPLDATLSRPNDDRALTAAEWVAVDDVQLRVAYSTAAASAATVLLPAPPAVD